MTDARRTYTTLKGTLVSIVGVMLPPRYWGSPYRHAYVLTWPISFFLWLGIAAVLWPPFLFFVFCRDVIYPYLLGIWNGDDP